MITGAAIGIGVAAANQSAHDGASVAIADIAADRATGAAQQITARGGTAIGLAVDVTDRAAVQALYACTEAELGSVHILVKCGRRRGLGCRR